MSVRVEAGRLSHADLGRTVEASDGKTGTIRAIDHDHDVTRIYLKRGYLRLDPHTLVTITGTIGKDQA